MANQEQIALLSQGVEVWNEWRKENLKVSINLSKASLTGMDLHGANFDKAIMIGANLTGANLSQASLCEVSLWKANLRGAILSKANLKDANLIEADLCTASLWKANLYNVNLYKADLRGANLCRAYLYKANLSETDLSQASLCEVYLCEANLYEADLSGADLEGANFERSDLLNIRFDPETNWSSIGSWADARDIPQEWKDESSQGNGIQQRFDGSMVSDGNSDVGSDSILLAD